MEVWANQTLYSSLPQIHTVHHVDRLTAAKARGEGIWSAFRSSSFLLLVEVLIGMRRWHMVRTFWRSFVQANN